MDRSEWIDQLGATLIYKVHRSFSWTLLITSALVLFWIGKAGLAITWHWILRLFSSNPTVAREA